MTSPAIAVFTKPNCPQCTATIRRLNKNGTAHTEVDITQDQTAYDYVIELGHQQAPVVVTSTGEHWSGFAPTRIDSLKETT